MQRQWYYSSPWTSCPFHWHIFCSRKWLDQVHQHHQVNDVPVLSSMPTTPQYNGSKFPTPISPSSRTGTRKGLQLGSSMKRRVNGDPIVDFARNLEAEMRMAVIAGGNSSWGNDDLMDINADEDWSMPFFSSSRNKIISFTCRCIRNGTKSVTFTWTIDPTSNNTAKQVHP